MSMQRTVTHVVSCEGIGVHTHCNARVTLLPALEHAGILFETTHGAVKLDATCAHSQGFYTVLQPPHAAQPWVLTIEHLLASVYSYQIDNLIIRVEGPEIPILDGSIAPWCALLQEAKPVEQAAIRVYHVVKQPVWVFSKGQWACCLPSCHGQTTLSLELVLRLPNQHSPMTVMIPDAMQLDQTHYTARTFGYYSDHQRLLTMGLAKGASLDNTLVLDDHHQPINPEGLRHPLECLYHKIMDMIGDLYILGYCVGQFRSYNPGHTLTHRLIQKIHQNDIT
jgi:UDP-3-O-[3-hydroxymyristoyl] N-acetylglucosamine deacetylase